MKLCKSKLMKVKPSILAIDRQQKGRFINITWSNVFLPVDRLVMQPRINIKKQLRV